MADEDRHRHRLFALVFQIILPGVARIQQYPRLVLALDLKAMETDVALPGIRVLGNH